MNRAEVAGLGVGLMVALILLASASGWLLSMPDTSAKVLVTVWLWALPVVGFCTAFGWLAGRLVARLPGAREEGS
jgi:hypothetical protein